MKILQQLAFHGTKMYLKQCVGFIQSYFFIRSVQLSHYNSCKAILTPLTKSKLLLTGVEDYSGGGLRMVLIQRCALFSTIAIRLPVLLTRATTCTNFSFIHPVVLLDNLLFNNLSTLSKAHARNVMAT